MRVLVINGSPKGARSNTYRLTKAFLEGIGEAEVREKAVSQIEIKPCLGCFSCWNKTPGRCILQDDMVDIIEDMLWADVILWSFPLYYFSVPGGLKNLMDRQLPMILPFMDANTESGGHPTRYDLSGKRHVLISTCGFYTAENNYEGVTAIFDHLCGNGNYTTIFCGQGELFRVKELNDRTEEYLSYVRTAGQEYAAAGISHQTRDKLDTLLFPREIFEAMADASWGIEKSGERTEETLTFTRQMAALYNKNSYSGRDLILEMYYSDVGKRYQILLGKEGSQVLTENFHDYTTRIETPYTVWKAIASGDLSGETALAQQKYRVKGDFDLMLHWDAYFGGQTSTPKEPNVQNAANMTVLLMPWIVFWVSASIHSFYGPLLSVAVCTLVPIWFFRNQKTIYDTVGVSLVTACAIAMILNVSQRVAVPISYLLFGLMWSLSCFTKVPLTACYSMKDYGGARAMSNPLFVKTNRILTACWGILYLLTPIWTWFLMGTAFGAWTGAINSVLPMLMGVFTVWFQKWYPAKVARG